MDLKDKKIRAGDRGVKVAGEKRIDEKSNINIEIIK